MNRFSNLNGSTIALQFIFPTSVPPVPPNPPTEVGILLPLLEILNGVWEILPVALRDETAGDDADHAKAGKDAVHNAEVVLTLL